jgi:hypothetical protein
MKKLFTLAIVGTSLLLIGSLTGCTGSPTSSNVTPAEGSGAKTPPPADGSATKPATPPAGGSDTKPAPEGSAPKAPEGSGSK